MKHATTLATCIQQAHCQGRRELLVPDKAFINLSLRLQLPIPEDEEGDEESTSNNPVCYGSVQVLVQMHISHSADAQPLCNCVVINTALHNIWDCAPRDPRQQVVISFSYCTYEEFATMVAKWVWRWQGSILTRSLAYRTDSLT